VTRSVRYGAGGQGRVTRLRVARPALGRLLGGLVLLAAGCRGGGVPAGAPTFSPADAAAAALAEYDANKDGALDAKELEQCPPLREALKRGLDKDKDGRVTADEIADRLRIYQEEGMMSTCVVRVLLDGNPLPDATVTLTPEKFLGPSYKPATGTTGPEGFAPLKSEGAQGGFVFYGFYRVAVTKQGAGGKEIIPARYNTQTTIGKEFAPARAQNRRGDDDETLVLRLTSR
jgi:EF hand